MVARRGVGRGVCRVSVHGKVVVRWGGVVVVADGGMV